MSKRLIVLAFFIFYFVITTTSYAAGYYFNDEFNDELLPNQLDSNKWDYYPNSNNSVLFETGGSVNLSPGIENNFPYIVTKDNPFPNGPFSLEIGFQYISSVKQGTGIVMSSIKPNNNISESQKNTPQIYFLGIWQGNDDGLIVTYQGYCPKNTSCSDPGKILIHTPAPNLSYHVFRVEYSGNTYKAYLDNIAILHSEINNTLPHSLWFGNPSFQNPENNWTNFKVDYIRIKKINDRFLDLPWDYKGKGLSFTDAALSINSFFDHEYPILGVSRLLKEPIEAANSVVTFMGPTQTNYYYSSHDGYDYGRKAQVLLGNPVLAAASGSATYSHTSSTGNTISIDHHNGYETRYYHMLPDGLVTKSGPVEVSAGEQIGLVGSTGNSTGPHIHFMVVQDKNIDNKFSDNFPDGITDPLGWQSPAPDPWANYTFNFLGHQKTGNISNYLYKEDLDEKDFLVESNGLSTSFGKFNLTLPQNSSSSSEFVLNLKSASVQPPDKSSAVIQQAIKILATDTSGNLINNFDQNYQVYYQANSEKNSDVKTARMVWSEDGVEWTAIPTIFNTQTRILTGTYDKPGIITAIARRLDTLAPNTKANIIGKLNSDNKYQGSIRLNLDVSDNPGGLGVSYTLYKINGDDWNVYKKPIQITDPGSYTVSYYSSDNDDNTEDIKTTTFDVIN